MFAFWLEPRKPPTDHQRITEQHSTAQYSTVQHTNDRGHPDLPHKMFMTRAISITNFLVATSALGFQVYVLITGHSTVPPGPSIKSSLLAAVETPPQHTSELLATTTNIAPTSTA
ncbi:hypothetical protein B0H63DRAFT_519836 [Podospora didyma]|uniref:Uncharacterized protein n=1 Tax=Podospora didyma TaxID=330526 RepID=A0AAE0U4T1_9PEZI|nr:hypothetical protein B0H63DRAFT_519836 [Podospora didyma]